MIGDDERDDGGKENGTVKHDKDDVHASGPLPPTSDNLADDKRHSKGVWAATEGYKGGQEGEGGVGQHCDGASRKNIKTKLTISMIYIDKFLYVMEERENRYCWY